MPRPLSVVLTIRAMLPADVQAAGRSLFQTTAFGVGAILANILGGILFERIGSTALFGVGATLAAIAGVVGLVTFPGRHGRRDVRRSDP